ncbi:ABC transporter ATP-binding protein/permease [Demequina sp. TTPB684]|uniref:ABC transporter ATP-binding protein n=1 Tax=unclassified Demequina TaxID=2620311 RepID=UPI001CF2F667|nr:MULTISPECIES: ABC transporter ATP-binding protein [unclassified Demequina]MCB2413615.1 ABC transporter ATP-binding protein/permease [Demequina sp. TTPB684]UPU88261.1 ABC transporter ATP-binding protein/permease [Demequina sp. TMPB413]
MKKLWSALRDLLPLLPGRARRFLTIYIVATAVLALFDVAAMSLLVLIISPVASDSPVVIPIVGELPESATPWVLLLACLLIIVKSALAVAMHWVATRQFAIYEFEIGARMFRAYLASSWEERSKRSTAEFTRIADTGISVALSGLILTLLTIPGNVLTIVLTLGVFVAAAPFTALVSLAYLGAVAAMINQVVGRRTLRSSRSNLDYSYRVARLLTEMVEAMKELTLRGRLDQIQSVVAHHRQGAVRARASLAFLSIIPRYAYEAALIGGFLLIGGANYLRGGLTAAIVGVAMFGVAGLRLVPALTGVQSGILTATSSLPWVDDVVNDLQGAEANATDALGGTDASELPAGPDTLTLTGIEFRYPTGTESVLLGLDLSVPLGSSLGIVGPSGSGKSTLIDILLGLRVPTQGTIAIDGTPLTDVIHAWRSRIGYVPQRVTLFDGTIGQNVALTWDDDYDRDKVLAVLEKAQLGSLVDSREHGIDERIGERGLSLSGGQQQRLGIARALYSDPIILVLDEATSALDTKTEDDVVRAIKELQGEVTLIAVAHRISTIKDYDQICYLDSGRILGKGSFSELAGSVPQFGLQVQLAGLGVADPESGAIT